MPSTKSSTPGALPSRYSAGGGDSPPPTATDILPCLEVCAKLFTALNEREIRYCHWKSNLRLAEALSGVTDLDLLLDPADAGAFKETLETLDFKVLLSPPLRKLPGIEDYLGFDSPSGRLVHLHVHTRIVLGRQQLKGHHLPVEKYLLDTREKVSCLYCASPPAELLLLFIRAHMKLEVRALPRVIARRILRRPASPFPEDIKAEMRYLAGVVSDDDLRTALRDSGLPLAAETVTRFVDDLRSGEETLAGLLATRRKVFTALQPFRRMGPLSAAARLALLALCRSRVAARLGMPRKKTLPGAAPFVALVGADGAGKSTLAARLAAWLGWKLEVRTAYLGIPKTFLTSSLVPALQSRLEGLARRLPPGFPSTVCSGLAAWLSDRRWLRIASSRLKTIRAARRRAASGVFILADRFPLPQFHSMAEPMDGPRIGSGAGGGSSRLEAREQALYGQMGLPDRVFVLKVPLSELRRRTKALDPVLHKMKTDAIEDLAPSEGMTLVDGSRPVEEVFLELKRLLWGML